MPKRTRKPVLTAAKKREILAILSVGCNQRTAAQYIGCSPSTIAQEARRDAHFAEELRRAAQNAEINYLRNIQSAATKQQYWRAAAWALERCRPDQYAARRTDSISLDQVREILVTLTQIVIDETPSAKCRKAILKRVDSLIRGMCLMVLTDNKPTKKKRSDATED